MPVVHGLSEHYGQNTLDAVAVSDDWELTRYEFSALKYLQRRGKKAGTTYAKDLCKAIWYLTYCVTRDKKFTAFVTELVLAYTGECPNATSNETAKHWRRMKHGPTNCS
jgi:hypothetical protein